MTTDHTFDPTARLNKAQFGLRALFTLVSAIAVATILIKSNIDVLLDDGGDNPTAHLSSLMLFAGVWAVIFLTSGGVTYAITNSMLKVALTALAAVATVFFLINANLVARITASV